MNPIIQTERTLLRPIAQTDCEAVFAYRSDKVSNRYQGWIPETLDEVKAFIDKNPKAFNTPNTWFQLVIMDRASDLLIGDIGIHFIDEHQCELGCTVSKVFQGKGFATEALSGVISYLFNKLKKHRITTSIDPQNINSIHLMQHLGFRKEGHFKQSIFINDSWVDDVVFAILNSEWTEVME